MPSRPADRQQRRRVLAGAAAALAALALTSVTRGLRPAPPPPDLDDLTTALDRASADSRLAADAAAAARGSAAGRALTAIAAERAAHAEALSEEIARMTGQAAPTTSSVTATTTTHRRTSAPGPALTADDVIAALRGSADSAAQAAATHRATAPGCSGSIAAACTAGYSVALTPTAGVDDLTGPVARPATPKRPSDAADGALFDAVATEHATIYGYGIVSAHSTPEVNDLVSEAMAEHRDQARSRRS